MGSCEQDLKTLDHTLLMLKEGTMKYQESNAITAVVGTKLKIRNQMLQIQALSMKSVKTKKWIEESHMVGGAIDVDTIIQDETVYCRDKERAVTRMVCKEYSEMTGNLATCQTCPNFKVTRRLLNGIEDDMA